MTWLTDSDGNRCSVEYFGSNEAAQKALDSLKKCKDCTNCSDCSYCSGCSYCSYCSGCSDCSRCSGCSRCSDCSYCSRCSRCSGCSGCSRCSYCSGCSDCSYCSGKKGEEEKPEIRNTVPVIENIHQRIYEAASQPTALEMSDWHTCEKTHCRAGWAVTLAGDAGRKLESFFNTELAAMMIYEASGYKIHPARFIDSNEDALADMKKLAQRP